ncbi:MAG: hypothetical protein AAF620_01065 [Bacteroidota bacterium]
MITIHEVLKLNRINIHGKQLYRKGEDKPYIEYCRKDYSSKKHITKPYELPFYPKELYLHPYYPHLDIEAIEIQYDGLFMKRHQIVQATLIKGERWFIIKPKRFALTEQDVYEYPEYFKPLYTKR